MNHQNAVDTPVLIIGAGPYGIAVAQELWHHGLNPIVIGDPFATWHRHTLDMMDLRSDPRGSSIWSPDDRYDFPSFLRQARSEGVKSGDGGEEDGEEDIVSVKLYRRYLESVENALPFRLIRGKVHKLERVGEHFRVTARQEGSDDSGFTEISLTSAAAIVATGLGNHRHLPTAFGNLPAERVLHSWDVDRIQELHGKQVLVLGGGQSAAETVLSVRRHNRVTWALKRPPLFFREPLRVPTPLFKLMLAGSSWIFRLPPVVLRAISRATFRTTITPRLSAGWKDPEIAKLITDADGLGLTAQESDGPIHCALDGKVYDAVISATGYRYSLAGLPFLSSGLEERLATSGNPPQLKSDFSTVVPGLYLVGGIAEGTHGPAARFVLGSRHAAKTLGRVLPKALKSTGPRRDVPLRAGQNPEASSARPS